MAKVNMFFFFGLLVYLSTLLHDATARGRKRLFSKRVNFKEILLPYPLTGPIMFCVHSKFLSQLHFKTFCAGKKTNFTECLAENVCDYYDL